MTDPNRRRAFAAATAATVAVAAAAAAGSPVMAQTATRHKAVFQVSDADPAKWNLTLNNVKNVINDLGEDSVELEVVAYGPGIGMLKAGSPVAERITEALHKGVKVAACENTMKAQHLTYADMLPDVGYVPSGVVELIKKQHAGFAYIRA